MLLQTTPPAALVRLGNSRLKYDAERLSQIYRTQHHDSIDDCLTFHLKNDSSRGGLLLQVYTLHVVFINCQIEQLVNCSDALRTEYKLTIL